MRDPNQKMRYSNAELSLIKNTFAGDDTYLYAVRKHMLGAELTEGEQKVIKSLTPEVKALIKKAFLPDIDGDSPIFQIVDIKMPLSADLKGKNKEEGQDIIAIKQVEVDYIQSRLDKLNDVQSDKAVPSIEEMGNLNHPNAFILIQARNYLFSYIDSFINDLRNLAGTKEETVEETVKRLAKNSTK